MPNNKNDDMDRMGNKIVPPREQGSNMTNQSDQSRGSELYNRDSGKATAATSRDSETRGSDSDRDRSSE